MFTKTNNSLGQTFTAIVCTVLFSATCVLSAVGPAQAKAGHPAPVVRSIA